MFYYYLKTFPPETLIIHRIPYPSISDIRLFLPYLGAHPSTVTIALERESPVLPLLEIGVGEEGRVKMRELGLVWGGGGR